nr:MAG TPA: hypothetical protein [Caudoviricetes sp.]
MPPAAALPLWGVLAGCCCLSRLAPALSRFSTLAACS